MRREHLMEGRHSVPDLEFDHILSYGMNCACDVVA
jgi:hypothetical protein